MYRQILPLLAPRQYLWHITLVIAACCSLLSQNCTFAAEPPERTIAVLLSEPGGLYREYFDALALALAHTAAPGKRPRLIELPAGRAHPDEDAFASVVAIIAVGVQAMRTASTWEKAPPVLSVLVPRSSYEKLLAEPSQARRRTQFSAIYLDQPITRQLNLVRRVLPEKRRVSVLLGPDSSHFMAPLRLASQRRGLELVSEEIVSESEIIPALSRLLASSDAFLALPDSLIFTRETARSVLMTAFRHQRPLIGFSQSYVTSGALVATYSTPAHIARQTADVIDALSISRVTLPAPMYPEYFSVALNTSVARALGLDLPSEAALHEALLAMPESR